MEVLLLKKARKDHEYWKKTGNVKIMKRITDLLNDIQKHPFTGIIGLCRFLAAQQEPHEKSIS